MTWLIFFIFSNFISVFISSFVGCYLFEHTVDRRPSLWLEVHQEKHRNIELGEGVIIFI